MIIMDMKIDNLYAFKNFHMNMSYPKKIVGSTISDEYLIDRPNFRYKKVNVIMGSNATGKTSLGKLIMFITNYFKDGVSQRFLGIINDSNKKSSLQMDFVTNENKLYRFSMNIAPQTFDSLDKNPVEISICYTNINKKDSYETCAKRLDEDDSKKTTIEKVDIKGWHFSYPQDSLLNKTYVTIEDDSRYLGVLEKVLKTLDPGIKEVIKWPEVENTYAIKWDNCNAIIKDGIIAEGNVLSSGTKAGLDISYILASLIANKHDFYYCDELFSYVNSDIEKACLSIIIDLLRDRQQLFFTTHNTEILDMLLPMHTFSFLKKDKNNIDAPITCVYADQYLKKNTDSLKNAVDNDLFCTAPELEKLFSVMNL